MTNVLQSKSWLLITIVMSILFPPVFAAADDPDPARNGTFQSDRPKMVIDEQRVTSKGIRKLAGKHLTLYTDLPSGKSVDELPKIFDLAVPQWCEYFGIAPQKAADWHMTGFVMKEKERFAAAGLLPNDLPAFLHGFQWGHELWIHEQPSEYYRRHLLLHEGTHAFMSWHLGGTGPPWYSEGTAELLGTHRWQDGKLTLNYFPKNRKETPYLGRIKIIRKEFRDKHGKPLFNIMRYDAQAHLQTSPYAWSWATAAFFDGHPDYQKAFRELGRHVRKTPREFNSYFYKELKPHWPKIHEQWQLYITDMDYAYDLKPEVILHKPGKALPAEGTDVVIRADRGWQSSGIRLEAGKTYQITAAGRYQVGNKPKPWWCEPGGVTIQYYKGKPLGILLGAIRDEQAVRDTITGLVSPQKIGLKRELSPQKSGTLYLRINEFSGGLSDNSGELTVRVTRKAEQ